MTAVAVRLGAVLTRLLWALLRFHHDEWLTAFLNTCPLLCKIIVKNNTETTWSVRGLCLQRLIQSQLWRFNRMASCVYNSYFWKASSSCHVACLLDLKRCKFPSARLRAGRTHAVLSGSTYCISGKKWGRVKVSKCRPLLRQQFESRTTGCVTSSAF